MTTDQRFEAAKAAMRGMLANPAHSEGLTMEQVDDCVYIADSLLARLKETEPVRLPCGADAHVIYPPDTVCECGLVRRMQP